MDLHHLLLAGLPAHFESSHPSHAVRSLSDIRFAEIRAPQMLVGQKGEEALDLINPALCPLPARAQERERTRHIAAHLGNSAASSMV